MLAVQARSHYVVWGERCTSTSNTVVDGVTIVGVAREIRFTACDVDGLPVGHQLPTQTDPRRPVVSLVPAGRTNETAAATLLLTVYRSNGAYDAVLTAPTHGPFLVVLVESIFVCADLLEGDTRQGPTRTKITTESLLDANLKDNYVRDPKRGRSVTVEISSMGFG